MVFWAPFDIQKEWPIIYVLKLVEGKVMADPDIALPF